MTLKFPKELILGGEEWKTQPFRFNVNAINTGSYTPSYRDVTVTGVSPLNLPNAEANGLRNIKLYGKCEQTGTPTLDNPIPIMCNNGAVGNIWFAPNLFDTNTATLNYFINSSGAEQYNTSWACTDYIPVVEGGIYKLTGVSSYGTSPRTGFYAEDKSFVSSRPQSSANFTIPEGVKYMRMSIYKSSLDSAEIKQIKSPTPETISLNGQTATAQDLLSCGDDYVDVQNVTTGEITRKVGAHIFDGTENWHQSANQPSSGICFQANTGLTNRAYGANLLGLCTHFKTVASSAIQQNINTFVYSISDEYIFVIVDSNDFPTVEDWTSYVANLYSQGKPIIITYPLATPTTETVTAQTNLQTIAGNNTLTITQAAVDGLQIEVTYSAGVEVTIQAVQNANVDQQVEVTIGG